jgi:hypothetical protein
LLGLPISLEDGESMFLQNVTELVPDFMALHTRRQHSSQALFATFLSLAFFLAYFLTLKMATEYSYNASGLLLDCTALHPIVQYPSRFILHVPCRALVQYQKNLLKVCKTINK